MDQPTQGTGTLPNLPPPAPPGVASPPVAPPPVAPPPVVAPAGSLGQPAGSAGRAASERAEGESHRGVALLLGLVAVLAAIVGARSTALANDAGDLWQTALRTEVKRSTGALEDIRYVYQAELPVAVVVMGERLKADELGTAAGAASGEVATTLAMEAAIERGVATAIEGSAPLVTEPGYALPGGGVDLGQRLADQRAETPDLLDLDPGALAAEGDHLAGKGSSMTLALLPLGLAALLGAMAQPFWRWRRPLLGAATGAMGTGLAIALMVEAFG
ncbi:MAG TPA: hypothetical protein VES19_14740 [Candidatus Limnocylindrales bacterium]|nr:hypothetical protein [Candidatus Limnocylindrales bacterium]